MPNFLCAFHFLSPTNVICVLICSCWWWLFFFGCFFFLLARSFDEIFVNGKDKCVLFLFSLICFFTFYHYEFFIFWYFSSFIMVWICLSEVYAHEWVIDYCMGIFLVKQKGNVYFVNVHFSRPHFTKNQNTVCGFMLKFSFFLFQVNK